MGPPRSTWRRSVRHWARGRRSKKVPGQRLQGTEVGAFPGVESRVIIIFVQQPLAFFRPSGFWPTGPKQGLCEAGWCKRYDDDDDDDDDEEEEEEEGEEGGRAAKAKIRRRDDFRYSYSNSYNWIST